MNIAVIAPHVHGNGCTTIAAMIAAELSNRNKRVCLSHAKSKSDSFLPYFKLREMDDINAKSLATMIKQDGLPKENVPNYCRSITDKLDLFSLDKDIQDGELSIEDVSIVAEFMLTNAPYDFIVYDVDENDLKFQVTKTIFDYADCIVLVLTQATTELNRFKEIQRKISKIAKENQIPIIVVLNKYDSLYGDVKTTAAKLGITNRTVIKKWKTVRYNKYIPYCENTGNMNLLNDRMKERQAEVLDISTDISNVVKEISLVRAGQRKIHNRTQVKGD